MYFARLFEVDKMNCAIGCLLGCPVVVLENTSRDGIRQTLYVTIPDYLHDASYSFKTGFNSRRFNYIAPVGAKEGNSIFIPATPESQAMSPPVEDMISFIRYIFRYWVPAIKHYYAYEVGSDFPGTTKGFVNDIESMVKGIASGVATAGQITSLYMGIWNNICVLGSPSRLRTYRDDFSTNSGITIFYPVNKLVGKKVSSVLKRCAIKFLIYPYPNEPMDVLNAKAGNYVAAFGDGFLPNVGLKGVLRYLQSHAPEGSTVDLSAFPQYYNFNMAAALPETLLPDAPNSGPQSASRSSVDVDEE